MHKKLIKRDIYDEIVKYINTDNIIVLHGARQVGKSHIMFYLEDFLKNQGKQTYFFDLEDARLVEVLNQGVDAALLFLGNEGLDLEKIKKSEERLYVFIDEIQYLEKPSPLMKLLGDHHKYIQLIVSGSSSFDIKSKFSDTLVGRTVDFEIFNLSFAEFLRFKNIKNAIGGNLDRYHLEKIKELYKEYVFFGGYPKIVMENSIEKKEKYLMQIIDTYIKKDIRDLAKIKDIKKFNNMLKVLATQSGQILNVSKLAEACSLAKQTVESYLFILENTYIIKLITPFSSSAKVEVIKAPKIFFYDTGIAQMLWLRKFPQNFVGNIFETSVFAELVKKHGKDTVYYWRNRNQNEIDFILQTGTEPLPIEVKMNFGNFRASSMDYFLERYKIKDYKIVGLEGEKKGDVCFYPWEI